MGPGTQVEWKRGPGRRGICAHGVLSQQDLAALDDPWQRPLAAFPEPQDVPALCSALTCCSRQRVQSGSVVLHSSFCSWGQALDFFKDSYECRQRARVQCVSGVRLQQPCQLLAPAFLQGFSRMPTLCCSTVSGPPGTQLALSCRAQASPTGPGLPPGAEGGLCWSPTPVPLN